MLGQNDYLGPLDKLSMLPLAAPGVLSLEHLRTQHDGETISNWWERVSGDVTVLERFIRPFCRGIQCSEPEQFSAYNFLGWIHHIAYDLPHALLGGYRAQLVPRGRLDAAALLRQSGGSRPGWQGVRAGGAARGLREAGLSFWRRA